MFSIKNSPKMVGYYSITPDREYDETASALRYFKMPRHFPLDLNIGIDTTKIKPDQYFDEKLNSILTYIVKNKDELANGVGTETDALIPSTKYVTFRGILKKIMESPFEKRDGWTILATKYKNNIYLCQLSKQEDNEFSSATKELLRRMCLWGPKFQQYCLTHDPLSVPDVSQEVDDRPQFFGVFQMMLMDRSFFYAGEMRGIKSETTVNLSNPDNFDELNFIDVKVCGYPTTEKFKINKTREVWVQNYLTGVKEVYFGIREKNGIVKKVKHYRMEELESIGKAYWSSSKCFAFLERFLNMVEGKTENIDCPNTVFKFDYDFENPEIICSEHYGKNEFSFLPDWYLKALN